MHDNTRGRPLNPEERAAFFAELYEQLAAPDQPGKARARTPEQNQRYRERANIRRRLAKLAEALTEVARALEEIHGDRSGLYHWRRVPLFAEAWEGAPRAPGLAARFERVRAEAAQGCELSARFVEDYEALLLLCDHLRQLRPPKRDPNWEPPEHLREFKRPPWRTGGPLPALDGVLDASD